MNLDRRLLSFLKEVRLPFCGAVIFAFGASLATIGQAWYLSRIIDLSFLKHYNLQQVLPLILIFILLTLGRFLSNWFGEISSSAMTAKIKLDLRQKLIGHLNKVSPIIIDLERRGELSNTIHNGVEALDDYFRTYIPQLFKAVLIPLVILFFIFPLDILSGIVFLFTAPVIPVFMILIGKLAEAATKKQWKTLSSMSAFLLDVIEGLTTLKILNRSKSQVAKIESVSEAFRRTTMKVLQIAFLSALVLEMAATLSTAVIAVEIGLRLLYAKMAFADALFILILAPEFYQPMRMLGASFHSGMEGFEAAQRMFEIFELPAQSVSFNRQLKTENEIPAIELKDVYYTYPHAKSPALRGISFKIPPGQKTVLIGKSGSGKSTIFNLLLKFIQAERGEILLNSLNLNELNSEDWYEYISWVPQNPYLFHDTIAENVRLTRPNATDEQVIEACKKAKLDAFIGKLPHGYETVIGERGERLSGGQAQRIALARAFLKDAPILLMDEPTANLDPQLDREIQEILQSFGGNKTRFIIAHRLNTVKTADQILVLSQGKISDCGSFEQLNEPGRYFSDTNKTATG
ncbi:MAG: thiol reductant ABC exporter subunit CydD [Calditrichaeota bacterium]|nr:thiol reductant ABC exporter subunit CydD [Calditrichota bacterium]